MGIIMDYAGEELVVIRFEGYYVPAVPDCYVVILNYGPYVVPLHDALQGAPCPFLMLVKVGSYPGQAR